MQRPDFLRHLNDFNLLMLLRGLSISVDYLHDVCQIIHNSLRLKLLFIINLDIKKKHINKQIHICMYRHIFLERNFNERIGGFGDALLYNEFNEMMQHIPTDLKFIFEMIDLKRRELF